MSEENNKYRISFIVGAIILWVIAYATIHANVPTIYAPFSLIVVVPTLLLSPFKQPIASLLGPMTIPILFAVWSFALLKGQKQIPKRTKIAAVILILLSLVLLAQSWKYGIRSQGIVHVLAMYIFNLFLWISLFFIYRSNAKHASYVSNFLFHWVLFAWLGWVAFPWLGELI